jgi:hypothetical protein
MEDNQKLQAILECHCQSIARVASNTELHASLKDYGYDTKMLQKGIELAEEVYALLYSFQEEPLQPYDLANSYWVISEQAQRRYCAIVKQLNSTASLNLELMKVIPPVVDTLAQSESLHTAYNLYRHLLINTERYADLLSFAGISVMMLEEELGILGEIAYLKTIRYRSLRDEEHHVIKRDSKIEELITYSHELSAIVSLINSPRETAPRLAEALIA